MLMPHRWSAMPITLLSTLDGWSIPFDLAYLDTEPVRGFTRPPCLIMLEAPGPTRRARIISAGVFTFAMLLLAWGNLRNGPASAHRGRRFADAVQLSFPEPSAKKTPFAESGTARNVTARRAGAASPYPSNLKRLGAGSGRREHPTLGSIHLQTLLQHEGELSSAFSSLPVDERAVFPTVYIRVNDEWFHALHETGERVYFSTVTPMDGEPTLCFDPDSGGLVTEQSRSPLWGVQEPNLVPALSNLRVSAARHLDSEIGTIRVFTWHPAHFENAIREVILRRLAQLGLQPSSVDTVTVRFRHTNDGLILDLEPIRRHAVRDSWSGA